MNPAVNPTSAPAPGFGSPAGAAAIPSLDGLRAVAVLLVFLAHSGLDRWLPGGLGVTIFFVLSGYLITTLMRNEQAADGGIDFRSFYLRRLLRLMPPLLIVVALAGLLSVLGWADGRFSLTGLVAVLFYVGNYHVIWHDFGGLPAGLGVVWSLAIEEHFYLFYPPLALWLLRRPQPGSAAAVLGLLCAAVLAWRYWLAGQGASEAYLGMASDTRVDAILVGCAMAIWRNPWPLAQRQPEHRSQQHPAVDRSAPTRLGSSAAGGGRSVVADHAAVVLAGAVLLFTLLYRDEGFRVTLRYTLQSLAIAVLIHAAVARSAQKPWRWLSAPVLVYLGSVSYTVYLSHHLILLAVARAAPAWPAAAAAALAALLTLVLAEGMRRAVEQPCAAWRRRLHQRSGAARRAADGLTAVVR